MSHRSSLPALAAVVALAGIVGCAPDPAPPPQVAFSEVLPTNSTAPDGLLTWEGRRSDWFELRVGQGEPAADPPVDWVVLDGVGLAGGPEAPVFWEFPEGTAVEADGHLVVFADDAASRDGELHVPVQLAQTGSLALVAPDGSLLDTVDWPMIRADHSWARTSVDGEWYEDPTPTPLARNDGANDGA